MPDAQKALPEVRGFSQNSGGKKSESGDMHLKLRRGTTDEMIPWHIYTCSLGRNICHCILDLPVTVCTLWLCSFILGCKSGWEMWQFGWHDDTWVMTCTDCIFLIPSLDVWESTAFSVFVPLFLALLTRLKLFVAIKRMCCWANWFILAGLTSVRQGSRH